MNSSTGISLGYVKAALGALLVAPVMIMVMWFATATQLNQIQDRLDELSARQQQTLVSCTTRQENIWFISTTTKSCTGDKTND